MLTNKNVRITGNVTFTSTVLFQGCNVLLDPGSTLTIQNLLYCRKSTTGIPTTFFGCQGMWKSIIVASGASVRLYDCLINDAESALVFQNGYKATNTYIQRCKFDRNLIAIAADGVSNFSFVQFEGNTITSGLNPNLMLQPYTATSVLAGISVNNTTGSVGTAGGVNNFVGLSFGINALNSTLSVKNSVFSYNLRQSYSVPSHPGAVNTNCGIGIQAINSRITVGGANSLGCGFLRNRIDIFSLKTIQLSVVNASFTDQVLAAVIIRNSLYPYKVSITESQFNLTGNYPLPVQNWVQIERASQSSGVNTIFSDNKFILLPAQSTSPNDIQMLNLTAQSGALDKCRISNNTVLYSYGNPVDGSITRTTDAGK